MKKLTLFVLLFCVLSVVFSEQIYTESHRMQLEKEGIQNSRYRSLFFAEEMRKNRKSLSGECQRFLDHVEKDSKYFPIPQSSLNRSLTVSYVDSWMFERSYGGKSGHEGTDIMAGKNIRGLYPIVSISDGVILNLGWLEKGGYRLGIMSPSGVYYYYAHLESYASIQEGDYVKAGQLLGFMGDSGYGKEGTVGMFDVHLHLGIYSWENGEEISVNPYYLLTYLEDKKLKYAYD